MWPPRLLQLQLQQKKSTQKYVCWYIQANVIHINIAICKCPSHDKGSPNSNNGSCSTANISTKRVIHRNSPTTHIHSIYLSHNSGKFRNSTVKSCIDINSMRSNRLLICSSNLRLQRSRHVIGFSLQVLQINVNETLYSGLNEESFLY